MITYVGSSKCVLLTSGRNTVALGSVCACNVYACSNKQAPFIYQRHHPFSTTLSVRTHAQHTRTHALYTRIHTYPHTHTHTYTQTHTHTIIHTHARRVHYVRVEVRRTHRRDPISLACQTDSA